MTRLGVGLVGCGTVGGGTAAILTASAAELERKTGTRFELCGIVDRDFTHARSLGLDEALFLTRLDDLVNNPAVDVVVELAGGTGFAKTVVETALRAGKSVVTANKALLATHGRELFALARSQGVAIGYEASCAGGIPVVRTLTEDLVANRITGLAGIVNGTCNYILSRMGNEGLDYPTALAEAQRLGFAEADPFLDVSGTDSLHKLILLASTAVGLWAEAGDITLRGLEGIGPADLAAAADLGARVKLLARAEEVGPEGWRFSVEPTVVPLPQALAALEGPFNGVLVQGSETGLVYFQGRGAGARPTASAVVSDLAALATGALGRVQATYAYWPDRAQRATVVACDQGPWFVYGAGRRPEVVAEGRRADLEAQGLRVLPWFDPRD